jgi:hypothetical protein
LKYKSFPNFQKEAYEQETKNDKNKLSRLIKKNKYFINEKEKKIKSSFCLKNRKKINNNYN